MNVLCAPLVTFAPALSGDERAPLRACVLAWAQKRPRSVYADTVAGMAATVRARQAPRATSFLLFDLHRLILYDETAAGDYPRLDSVMQFIADAHPIVPFGLLLADAGAQPLLYGPEVVDAVLSLWPDPVPGVVRVADVVTGEVTAVEAREHPECTSHAGTEAPVVLRDVWVGESLRVAGPGQTDGLLSAAAGVIRRLVDQVDETSLPGTMARGVGPDQRSHTCFGKDLRPRASRSIAAYEALERFQVSFRSNDMPLVYGSYDELRGTSVDPATLFFSIHGRLPAGVMRYDPQVPLYWTRATDLLDSRTALVPAQEVWFNTSGLPGEHRFVRSTTSGSAVGGSVEEAATFALLEAIERDAFLVTWYLQPRCHRIDPDSIAYEPFQLLRRRWESRFPHLALRFIDIMTDTRVPTVLLVAAAHPGHVPRVRVAAATRLSVGRAAFAALKDLTDSRSTIFPPHLARARELLRDPSHIRTPEDHCYYYCFDETFSRLDFLDLDSPPDITAEEVNGRALIGCQERYNLRELLVRVAENIRAIGGSVLLKDLTHPALADRGVRCVRAITPGLYPLWFGSPRFAVTDRLRRLAQARTMRTVRTAEDCNLQIHPFP